MVLSYLPFKEVLPLKDTYDLSSDKDNSLDILHAQMTLQQQYDMLETAFMQKNLPPICQKIQFYVEKYLNNHEYPNSYIYDIYPSTASLYQMADTIYMELCDDNLDTYTQSDRYPQNHYAKRDLLYTMIFPLLLNELYKKRMRKYLSTLYDYPPYASHPFF